MAAINDVTGDSIKSKILSEEGRNNYDFIFAKPNQYHLFLDDQRNPEDAHLADESHVSLIKKSGISNWIIVRDYDEFVYCIEKKGIPKTVSFDHDLHFEHVRYYFEHAQLNGFIEYGNFKEKTGKHCADYLVQKIIESRLAFTPHFYIHSANEYGRVEIQKSLDVLEQYKYD